MSRKIKILIIGDTNETDETLRKLLEKFKDDILCIDGKFNCTCTEITNSDEVEQEKTGRVKLLEEVISLLRDVADLSVDTTASNLSAWIPLGERARKLLKKQPPGLDSLESKIK